MDPTTLWDTFSSKEALLLSREWMRQGGTLGIDNHQWFRVLNSRPKFFRNTKSKQMFLLRLSSDWPPKNASWNDWWATAPVHTWCIDKWSQKLMGAGNSWLHLGSPIDLDNCYFGSWVRTLTPTVVVAPFSQSICEKYQYLLPTKQLPLTVVKATIWSLG